MQNVGFKVVYSPVKIKGLYIFFNLLYSIPNSPLPYHVAILIFYNYLALLRPECGALSLGELWSPQKMVNIPLTSRKEVKRD